MLRVDADNGCGRAAGGRCCQMLGVRGRLPEGYLFPDVPLSAKLTNNPARDPQDLHAPPFIGEPMNNYSINIGFYCKFT